MVVAGWWVIHSRQNRITGDYLYSNSQEVSLLDLTEQQDGKLTGTLYAVSLDKNHVSQHNIAVHGTADGNHITLELGGTIGSWFGDGTVSGEKVGNTLHLILGNGEIAFESSTLNTFQQKVDSLRQKVASQQIADNAHLFTDGQVLRIEKALTRSHYLIYILTVPHNSNLSTLANQIFFQEQRMRGVDALLAIDPGDQRVQLVAERGSTLDQMITSNEPGSSVSDKYSEITDQYFVPYARKGDFSEAVIQTIRAIDKLSTNVSG
ncbi:TPM domain-containing protein [Alicyclobacillus kakegawensis]|uniref:TPM domain-containing protein n=1 Tax=Alicyclobacillus kakegawensis TaxID=392012 RepID=UPI000A8B6277|nr:TPM domain-containing protein [Alicyclobacillus kakegawensis]